MTRWKKLPENLDPLVVQFVAELRRMKDAGGLSLDRLARRTSVSASSWDRYLGGRALAPPEAIRALAAVAELDETRALVLYEAAREAWEAGRPEDGQSPQMPDDGVDSDTDRDSGTDAGHRLSLGQAAVVALASALAASALTLAVTRPWNHGHTAAAPQPAPSATPHYTCTFTQIGGKWYAGNSTATNTLVKYDMTGPIVAEVQCLLQHAGHPAGPIDGIYGPRTLRAVIQEQNAAHIDLDGQVGSQTWDSLRG